MKLVRVLVEVFWLDVPHYAGAFRYLEDDAAKSLIADGSADPQAEPTSEQKAEAVAVRKEWEDKKAVAAAAEAA